MYIYLTNIRSSKTLASKIQQAFLKNDTIDGRIHESAMRNLPVPVIKILFKKEWLVNYWRFLPYYTPWEEFDLEYSSLKYSTIKHLLSRDDFQEKAKKTPIFHIANFIVNEIPLPEEIPEKIIVNDFLSEILDGYGIKSNLLLIDIIKYMNHKETKIELKQYPNLPENIANAVIDNIKIENEILYYFCLKYCDLNNIPEPMKKLLLKPFPYDGVFWHRRRIEFLLINKFITVDLSHETIIDLFTKGTSLSTLFNPIINRDLTSGPIKLNL